MNKTEARSSYQAKRKALSDEEIEENSLKIANNLLQIPIWNGVYYHLFLSIATKKEVDTTLILPLLAGKDKEIVVSKSDFSTRKMTHYLLTDNTKIRINSYQIPEPEDGIEVPVSKIDVVFVPLLAFDTKGNRVGYGKGFYDEFLSNCKPETLKIGLSFFEAEDQIEPLSPTDIKLDYCITPHKVYTFKK